jgi:hypothetical protein
MTRGRRLLLVLLLVLMTALGMAQAGAQQLVLPPSDALACMTPPQAARGLPEYPADHLAAKYGDTVRVELVFTSADAGPTVRALDERGKDAFYDAVLAHVRQLRVPCHPAGAEPTRIVLAYVFRPDDGRPVVALPPRDLATAERDQQAACLMRIVPDQHPEYPHTALRKDHEGKFLVHLRFADPAQPPEVRFTAGPPHKSLRDTISAFAAGYRLPCLSGAPKTIGALYDFRIDGNPRTVIEDMTLRRLLGAAASMPLPARFDFTTMACPFDLRISYFRPHARNGVQQVGVDDPQRHAFLHWLSELTLRLTPEQALQVMGDTFTVSVPCAKLDL